MLVCILALLVIPVSADELPVDDPAVGDVIYILASDTDLLASINNSYGVGTSNISIFGPIASKLPYGVHYVYWRESQYVYKLAYSADLIFEGGRFSADQVTVISYTSSSGYQSQATFTTNTESSFRLDPDDYLVWSDLGDYPTLYERGVVDYAQLSCVILASFGLFALWDRLVACCRGR